MAVFPSSTKTAGLWFCFWYDTNGTSSLIAGHANYCPTLAADQAYVAPAGTTLLGVGLLRHTSSK